jgi:hypothetical protein
MVMILNMSGFTAFAAYTAHPDRIIRVLRGEPVSWDEIFRQLDEDPFPPEFMADRDQGV